MVLAGSAALAVVAFALGALFGDQPLSFSQVLNPGTTDAAIFESLRLPRVALASMVGASLAASGCALQGLMRNPLADPFVLGVSGGSALGATVALAFGLTVSALPGLSAVSAMALLGGLGATVLVMGLGRVAGGGPHATLLAGVIFNAFALAVIIFIKALVAPDQLGQVLFWLAGALGYEKPFTLVAIGAVELLVIGALWMMSGRLNLLLLGDDDAASLGVDVRRTRLALLLCASVSVSAAVSLSGLVGFVGLLVPHLARLTLGPDQRLLLPASALGGAAFLTLSDLLARMAFRFFHVEPPVGVVTALLGGPVFLLLMGRGRERAT
jgi:iron complex transport system permease protein